MCYLCSDGKIYSEKQSTVALMTAALACFSVSCKEDDDDENNGKTEEVVDDNEKNDEEDKSEPVVVVVKAPEGVVGKGVFKVSATKSVYFSKGNLQYCVGDGSVEHTSATGTAKGTWRFAEKQYEVIGDGNANISETYAGWIDLFAWGTSGWDSDARAYQPWDTLSANNGYFVGGEYTNCLASDYAKADWGVFNAISNGGDKVGVWRTLTSEEWAYLFQNNGWTIAKVDGNLCFLLFPADVKLPEGITVDNIHSATADFELVNETKYADNTYTAEQFAELEEQGVVALPCGGLRKANKVESVGTVGRYWSSSAATQKYSAVAFMVSATSIVSNEEDFRNCGLSVRLVQDIQEEK